MNFQDLSTVKNALSSVISTLGLYNKFAEEEPELLSNQLMKSIGFEALSNKDTIRELNDALFLVSRAYRELDPEPLPW